MAEFEQALLVDILLYVENNGQVDHVAHGWAGSGPGDNSRNYYLEWLAELTNGGSSYPDRIDASRFHEFVQIWAPESSYNATRGYVYDNLDYKPSALVKLLTFAKNNCSN